MKVLVTGGMGVMGAEVSRKLVQEGHRPVLFSRHLDENLIRDILDRVDVELGDVLDLPRLLHAIKRHSVTHIIHMAAFVGAVSEQNPALSIHVNVVGTANVLEAARLFDAKRVVFTSAAGVYAPIDGEHGFPKYKPITEDYPRTQNPIRIYDAGKLMCEHTVEYYRRTFGVDAVILRFSFTYGPGKTSRHGKMGVTSAIVENPVKGQPFRLAAGGDEKADFIYNKDSALGVFLATITPKVKSSVFNIGSGVGATLRDIANVVRGHIPDADIEVGGGLNPLGFPYSPYSVFDISRARAELGYVPQYDLERGIADYIASVRSK